MVRRGKGNDWRKRLTKVLEFPPDVILDLPRLIMEGNTRLTIENHGGVVEYSTERIRLRIHDGELMITGEKLIIATILGDEVEIEGNITRVDFLT